MSFEWLEQVRLVAMDIGNFLADAWKWLVGIVPTIDAICISLIAYYTFRLTVFPKKLKFINIRYSFNTFEGDSVEITLENRSLCPSVIQSIDMIIGKDKIQFSKEEHIIEGFKTAKIRMQPYTCIVSNNGKVDINSSNTSKMLLLVKTTRGVQRIRYARISQFAWWLIRKRDEKYEHTMVVRDCCDDRVVSLHVKYALSFVDSTGECHTVLIHESGGMNKPLFGYNALPEPIMKSEATLRAHFDTEFKKCNLKYSLFTIKHPHIEEEESVAP